MSKRNPWTFSALFVASLFFSACGEDDVENPDNDNEQEVITTVTLTFTPSGGGAAITASFRDPDGDGGANPTIDAITLSQGTTYAVSVEFLNELEDPAEDITEEVEEEAAEHQVFFHGDAVQGPATGNNPSALVEHSYNDTDGDGFPLGLSNTIEAVAPGTGTLSLVLRHLPPVNETPVKTGTLADDMASGGIGALPGDTDVNVSFDLTVQ